MESLYDITKVDALNRKALDYLIEQGYIEAPIEEEDYEVPEFVHVGIMYRDAGNYKNYNSWILSNEKGYNRAVIEAAMGYLETDPVIADYYGLPNMAPIENEFLPSPDDDHSFIEPSLEYESYPIYEKGDYRRETEYDISGAVEGVCNPDLVKAKREEARKWAMEYLKKHIKTINTKTKN